MIDFLFTNNVSISNVRWILIRRCEIKFVQYLLVMGSRDRWILSWVVAFKIYLAFSNHNPQFLVISEGVTTTLHLGDWPEVEHVDPLLLLHWRSVWWIPIVFIWNSNVSTCLNIVIFGVPINEATFGSHYWHWYMGVLIFASITSGLCWLLGSSNIGIPKVRYLLGFIKVISILLPNHKPWPNINIMTSPDSILYEFAPVHIDIFTCSEYASRKGAIVHSFDVNDIGLMFPTKQCVSAWLSVYV